jgi:transcriptional regulator with XRE-family HTH domain
MATPIRLLREQAGMTQAEFARALEISQARLSNYERGERQLPTDIAHKARVVLAARGTEATLDHFYPAPAVARRRRSA